MSKGLSVSKFLNDSILRERIEREIFRIKSYEKDYSWVLAVLAGIALRYADIGITGDSVYNGIAQIPLALIANESLFGPVGGAIIAGLFGAGILAAMLSTADSFMIATTFTFVYDIWPTTERKSEIVHELPRKAIRVGRLAAITMIILGLGSFWIASTFGFDIISLLFGAFGAQVSLFAPVLGTLVLGKYAPSSRWAFASIASGFIGAAYSTFIALQNPAWALYGPLWALGLSVPVFLCGVLFRSMTQE